MKTFEERFRNAMEKQRIEGLLDTTKYIERYDFAMQLFKEELKRTLDELIGEEETPANKGFFMWCQGYNQKRKEIIDIRNKLI